MINKIFSILQKDLKIEFSKGHLFFSVILYVVSSIYIVYLSFQPSGLFNLEVWVSIFWILILFASISSVSKSFFQESQKRNLYYYFIVSPDELIISKLVYNFLFLSGIVLLTFIIFSFLLGDIIISKNFFVVLLILGSLSISNCLTLISAISYQVENNSLIISVLSFPVILPILLLLVRVSKISSIDFSWNLIREDIYLLILLNIILLALTKVLFNYLWRN